MDSKRFTSTQDTGQSFWYVYNMFFCLACQKLVLLALFKCFIFLKLTKDQHEETDILKGIYFNEIHHSPFSSFENANPFMDFTVKHPVLSSNTNEAFCHLASSLQS